MDVLIAAAVGYLVGSIPSGHLVGRRVGVDVRRAGSGNVGAANVARLAGLGPAVATFVADAAKALVALAVTAPLGAPPVAGVGVDRRAQLAAVAAGSRPAPDEAAPET